MNGRTHPRRIFSRAGFLVSLVLVWLGPRLFIATAEAKESIHAPNVKIDWLAPQTFATAGETLVGIRFRPEPHWHVYWKNPGDSGAAPKFEIQAQGASVGEILWPFPKRLPVAHLTNLGYEGEAAYLFRVKTEGASRVVINVGLEWLVCKEECIPGFGRLTLSRLAVGDEPVYIPSTRLSLDGFAAQIPQQDVSSGHRLKLISSGNNQITVQVETDSRVVDLFPIDPEYVSPAEPQRLLHETGYHLVFATSPTSPRPKNLGFVLVADQKAYEFPALPLSSPTASPTRSTTTPVLWFLIFSAFVGGLILNLMPCVLPILSIKAFSLLKTADAAERRRDGLHYSSGVLVAFILLGSGFLVLRSIGTGVGWGFQLQSPIFVFILGVLFWILALSFLGAIEMGTSVMNTAGRVTSRSAFGTGLLAVFVAAPCTGPFMGGALGAAATLPAVSAIAIFVALGFGLSMPYLLLSFSPNLARALPRPGPWMETFKQFLAFPLFATVVWLFWVLGQQTGTQGWLWGCSGLLGVSLCIWISKHFGRLGKLVSGALVLILVLLISQFLNSSTLATSPEAKASSDWKPYSDDVLNAAIAKGQPVFVDFTAAWCITCQVNKTAVLETEAADALFENSGVLRLRADWTSRDATIGAALSRLGRQSVPVYAYYPGIPEPILLPQILTMNSLHEVIETKEIR